MFLEENLWKKLKYRAIFTQKFAQNKDILDLESDKIRQIFYLCGFEWF